MSQHHKSGLPSSLSNRLSRRLSNNVSLYPLTALALAACGDGGSGSSPIVPRTPPAPTETLTGRVYDGPIDGAQVYFDVDGDGVLDAEDVLVATTDARGEFTISAEHLAAHGDKPLLVVLAGATDIGNDLDDPRDDTLLTSGTWRAPAGSSVISPLTDLLVRAELTNARVVDLLGLPEGVDVTQYDPYDSDTLDATDLEVIAAAQTVAEVLAELDATGAEVTPEVIEAAIVEAFDEEPPALTLANAVNTLAEDTVTTERVKIADLVVTDADTDDADHSYSLSGEDADLFEVDGDELFLKAGVELDFGTNPSLDVTVTVDGAGLMVRHTIAIPNGNEVLFTATADVDTFNGMLDDTLYEATVSYASSDAAVTVDLSGSTANVGGYAEGDTLSNIADLIGSGFGDTLSGDANRNVIDGGAGDDTLFGGTGGADTLRGGAGNDVLDGGVGFNSLDGGDDTDPTESDIYVLHRYQTDDENRPTYDTVERFNGEDKIRIYLSQAEYDLVTAETDSEGNTRSDALKLAQLYASAQLAVGYQPEVVNERGEVTTIGLTTITNDRGTTDTIDDQRIMLLDGYSTLLTYDDFELVAEELPTAFRLTNVAVNALAEDADTGTRTKVADLVVTDADTESADQTYILSGDDADLFEVDGAELYLKAGVELDFETNPSLDVTVAVYDTGLEVRHAIAIASIDNEVLFTATADVDTFNGMLDDTLYEATVSYASSTASVRVSLQSIVDIEGTAWQVVLVASSGTSVSSGNANHYVIALDDGSWDVIVRASLYTSGTYITFGQLDNLGTGWVTAPLGDSVTINDAGFLVATEANLGGGYATGDRLSNIANLIGSAFNDTLTGDANDNVIDGGDGGDAIDGGDGADTLRGGDGDDTLTGGDGSDTLRGGEGADSLSGGAENDVLEGGAGADSLDGGAGADSLDGGAGADSLDGGAGVDTASYAASEEGVRVSLQSIVDVDGKAWQVNLAAHAGLSLTASHYVIARDTDGDGVWDVETIDTLPDGTYINLGQLDAAATGWTTAPSSDSVIIQGTNLVVAETNFGGGDATGDSLDNIENLIGSAYVDTLTGNDEDNVIDGGDGGDLIEGSGGADTLRGGRGDDHIDGGAGDDVIEGGAGSDRLIGDTGADTASYASSDEGVRVILQSVVDVNGVVWQVSIAAHAGIDLSISTADHYVVASDLDNDGVWDIRTIAAAPTGADINLGQLNAAGTDWVTMDADGNAVAPPDDSVFTINAAGDSLVVAAVNSVLVGGHAEDDTLTGIENLIGSAYADTLTGDDGDNVIEGGGGADTIDGGAGFDTASYASSTAAVSVDLSGATLSSGDATGDTLTNIENLLGSAFADTLTGDDDDNAITGGAGADTIDGGAGIDTVSYADSDEGVTIGLSGAAGSGGDAAGDTLTNIETLIGSGLDDILTGDELDNSLFGGDGDDTLRGGRGNDYIEGGAGDDVLDGGSQGFDILVGGSLFGLEGGDDIDTYVLRHKASDENGGSTFDTVTQFDSNDKIRVYLSQADVTAITDAADADKLDELQARAGLAIVTLVNPDPNPLFPDPLFGTNLVLNAVPDNAASGVIAMFLQGYEDALTIDNFEVVEDTTAQPTVLTLAQTRTTIAEGRTTELTKIADLGVADADTDSADQVYVLSGADAGLFVVIGSELFIKAGAAVDFETNSQLDVTVGVAGTSVPTQTASVTVTDVTGDPTITASTDTALTLGTTVYGAETDTNVGITVSAGATLSISDSDDLLFRIADDGSLFIRENSMFALTDANSDSEIVLTVTAIDDTTNLVANLDILLDIA